MQPDGRQVIPLGNARVPADHGLSGLGLIMQLGGALFATFTALFGFSQLMVMSRIPGGAKKEVVWLFLLVLVGIARSAYHRAAGTEILYGGQPARAVRRYAWFGLVHTALWIVFLKWSLDAPVAAMAPLVLLFAAWPVALLALFSRGPLGALDEPTPVPADRGFEGAGILMVVLGICGALFSAILLLALLDVPTGRGGRPLVFQLFLLVLMGLVVRSLIHVHAGWVATTSRDLDRATHAVTRYGNVGVITGIVACAVLLIGGMSAGGGAGFVAVIMVFGIGVLLLVWPLAIRRFFAERRFAGLADGGDVPTTNEAAPDHGLATFGWLLLALGSMALAGSLAAALFTARGRGLDSEVMAMMTGFLPRSFDQSPWWNVGVAALQVWAGLELIRMTDRYRLAATIYGVVGAAITIWINLPVLEAIEQLGRGFGRGRDLFGITIYGGVALSLVVPIAAAIVAQRGGTPVARARYVDRSAD